MRLEHRVQRWPADLREPGDLRLAHAVGERLFGGGGNLGRYLGEFAAQVRSALAECRQGFAPARASRGVHLAQAGPGVDDIVSRALGRDQFPFADSRCGTVLEVFPFGRCHLGSPRSRDQVLGLPQVTAIGDADIQQRAFSVTHEIYGASGFGHDKEYTHAPLTYSPTARKVLCMEITQNLTSRQRREITAREIRNATLDLARRNGGHLSGQQIAAAKGIGRKRALAIIDAKCADPLPEYHVDNEGYVIHDV